MIVDTLVLANVSLGVRWQTFSSQDLLVAQWLALFEGILSTRLRGTIVLSALVSTGNYADSSMASYRNIYTSLLLVIAKSTDKELIRQQP